MTELVTHPRPARRRPRLLVALAALGTLVAALLGVASASPASASPIYGNWSISGPFGGGMNDVKSVFLDGLVFFDRSPGGSQYKWIKSGDGYIGPGGREYHSYKNVTTGRCLSHASDYVIAVTCNWNDYSQWWSIETVVVGYNPVPPGQLPFPILANIMTSWTAPTKAITQQDDLSILTTRIGTLGSAAQRLKVNQLIIPA